MTGRNQGRNHDTIPDRREASRPSGDKRPPLTVSDLSVEFYGEPRIHDLFLAERLGFKRAYDIRELIGRNKAELETYGALIHQRAMNAGPATSPGANIPYGTEKLDGSMAERRALGRRGRPTKEYWLNEGQALTLCALARTSVAARIRRELVTVFIAYRQGESIVPVHIDPKVADLDAINVTLGQMKAEMATLRRAVTSSIELAKEQARALEVAASASISRIAGPKAVKSAHARTALLYGTEAIGEYLGLSNRQVSHLHYAGNLPTFKVGGRVCADTSSLDKWIVGKSKDAARIVAVCTGEAHHG